MSKTTRRRTLQQSPRPITDDLARALNAVAPDTVTLDLALGDLPYGANPALSSDAFVWAVVTRAQLENSSLAHLPLTRLTPMDVTAHFTQRRAEYSLAVVKRECAILARALRYAHATWGCPVTHLLRALKNGAHTATTQPLATPAEDDIQTLITAAAQHGRHGPLLAAAIRLIADTGMRGKELLTLTWADVHLDHGMVSIPRTPPMASRRMLLSDGTVLALRALGPAGKERVFGAFKDAARLSRVLHRIAAASNLPPIRLASFRHAVHQRLAAANAS